MGQTAFLSGSSFYLALALPLLTSTMATYLWRETVGRPWLFWIVSVIALYVLLALAFTWAFAGIGITGVPDQQQGHTSNPLASRVYLASAGLIIVGALMLWGLRVLMVKH